MNDPAGHSVRLLTRGDDAASSRSANRAIAECFTDGLLRNVSVMAPCAFVEDAADVQAACCERGVECIRYTDAWPPT